MVTAVSSLLPAIRDSGHGDYGVVSRGLGRSGLVLLQGVPSEIEGDVERSDRFVKTTDIGGT